MDLTLNDEQLALAATAREWLQANVPRHPLPPAATHDGFEAHRAWERALFEAGFAAVHWPEEYGGRGLDPMTAAVFQSEYVASGAPARLNRIGIGLVGPTLFHHGTIEQRERWLTRTLSGEVIWCQGFSEPDAGSDLAALRTSGVVDGDVIRVTGQKIWTSYARFADWIFALVRTEPGSVGHRGISCLAIDLATPGVEVRPIRQLNGLDEFCEIFFTDAEVPLCNVIGELGAGWAVAGTALKHERSGGSSTADHLGQVLDEAIGMMAPSQREDPTLLIEIGRLRERIEAHRGMQQRTLSQLQLGRTPGRHALMNKLWWSETQVAVHALGMKALGENALTIDSGDDTFRARYWLARASKIYAGTNEVQRNIIAERGLGLPREPRHAV